MNAKAVRELEALDARAAELQREHGSADRSRREAIKAELNEICEQAAQLNQDILIDWLSRLQNQVSRDSKTDNQGSHI